MSKTEIFHICNKCKIWLSGVENDKIITNMKYFMVRDPSPGENWETCSPFNDYFTYCENCHMKRLYEGSKRVIGRKY